MRLKLGIIGVPADWQRRYVPALRVLADRFDVVGIYSSVMRLAENAAREFGTSAFASYRELLSQEDLDAVLVLANDWYGLAPIYAACDNGKAVYCGSDVDFQFQQATELSDAVESAGIAFMAEFPRRYAPASLRLKELIATQLGQPEMLFCHRRMQNDSDSRSRRSESQRLQREQLELIDWCSFIVGSPPAAIQCTQHPVGSQPTRSDYAAYSLRFAGSTETIAQVSCGSYIRESWHEAISFRPPSSLQVCCAGGLAFLDLPNGITWFDDAGRHQESLDSEVGVGQQLLTQFHRAITSLVRKMGDLDDVTRCLKILDAGQQSAAQGRTIAL